MKFKILIIIVLMSACSAMNGQNNNDILENINFNDTTLVGSETVTSMVMEYIAFCQDTTKSAQNQIYDVILAVDNVLAHCNNFPMYKFVYQYLICGFSEIGINQLVDYMMRLPYVELLDIDEDEFNELYELSQKYCRVKIGSKTPDLQAVTIDGTEFDLDRLNARYTVLLFWSSNCQHCRDLLKEFGTYLSDKQDVAFVNVCVVGNVKTARRLVRKAKVKGVTICDGMEWKSQIVNDFAVDMTPTMFLLDENKTIISKPFGIEDIDKIIKME